MRRCEFCDSPVPADATICPVCREKIAEESLERILPLLKRPESETVRVRGTVDRLWGVIRKPAPTYRDIGQSPDFLGPFIIIIANALVFAVLFLAMASKITQMGPAFDPVLNATIIQPVSVLSLDSSMQFYSAALVSIMPSIMMGMLYLIVGSAFAHFAFKLAGGTGRKSKTIAIVGYSITPVVIFRLIATVFVLAAMEPIAFESYGSWELVFGALYASPMWLTIDWITQISFLWVGFLLIFGIREAHDTSTMWALVISILCMIVLSWTFWTAH
ncbi:MAG: YIP1 family protein [Candidatus Thorarchaeota archaeon]